MQKEKLILSPKKKEEKELIELVNNLQNTKAESAVLSSMYEEEKTFVYERLEKYMDEVGTKSVFVKNYDGNLFKIAQVERKKINWLNDKLKNILNKDCQKQVVKKKYIILNYPKVVELLKQYNVPAKEFTQFIYVEEEIDEKALSELEALGKVKADDLNGTYTVDVTSKYLSMKEIKDEQ